MRTCGWHPDSINVCGEPATKCVELHPRAPDGTPEPVYYIWLCDVCHADPRVKQWWLNMNVRANF